MASSFIICALYVCLIHLNSIKMKLHSSDHRNSKFSIYCSEHCLKSCVLYVLDHPAARRHLSAGDRHCAAATCTG